MTSAKNINQVEDIAVEDVFPWETIPACECPICLAVVLEENALSVCPECGGKPLEAGGWREV